MPKHPRRSKAPRKKNIRKRHDNGNRHLPVETQHASSSSSSVNNLPKGLDPRGFFSEDSIRRQLKYLVPGSLNEEESTSNAHCPCYRSCCFCVCCCCCCPSSSVRNQSSSGYCIGAGDWSFDVSAYFAPPPRSGSILADGATSGAVQEAGCCAAAESSMQYTKVLEAFTQLDLEPSSSSRQEHGLSRDEWPCDFCGSECFCWTVGLDG
ncbi:uncharacterized protein K460DRAFT_435518 [Cucurbitaria berberidis CBS 394.84]|uniref:Uncharacterized protein n=1 Tax=Cucurbitaria berberidis CBS 394.84 TaxID=1168544 RepID=A0A9P4GAY1_9PLEO|nr:uncharacterized protein K460DRAFT_435518 [Cucurbitaria berberidis CBS 394.84]KAF1842189.1 hypothetical protein K460DRAFT_435518 [Cucurbitaria berberidis CBS 394.84]